jgi:phage protein D
VSSSDFFTWNRSVHFIVIYGKVTADMLRDRLLNVVYTDRLNQFDTLELELDNHDGQMTSAENIASGLVLGIKLGYIDEVTEWKVFILNRIQGGVGSTFKDRPMRESQGKVTYIGRNRNAPGGPTGKARWGRTAKPERKAPKPTKSGKPRKNAHREYGASKDALQIEAALNQIRDRYIPGKRTSDIIRIIAERLGFKGPTAIIQPTEDNIEGYTMPAGMKDRQVLQSLARTFGFIFRISAGKLWWCSSQWSGNVFDLVSTFNFGADKDTLDLTIDCDWRLPIPGNITAKSYNDRLRHIVVQGVSLADAVKTASPMSAFLYEMAKDSRSQLSWEETLQASGSKGFINQKILSRFQKRNYNAFQINLKVVGDPRLLAGRAVGILGTGSPLVDGEWLITEARHTIPRSDYTVEMHLKHPKNKTKSCRRRAIRFGDDLGKRSIVYEDICTASTGNVGGGSGKPASKYRPAQRPMETRAGTSTAVPWRPMATNPTTPLVDNTVARGAK